MIQWIISFLFVFCGLFADVPEPVFNDQKNFPLTSHYKITPKVNITTGEYIEEECDLVVAGSEPLSFRRFYGHFSPYHPAYASWRLNPEHFCAANFEWGEQAKFVALGAVDGGVVCYDQQNQDQFVFNLATQPHFAYAEASGQNHPLNTKIFYRKAEVDRNNFCWEGRIVQGDGSQKTFKTPKHSWLHKIRLFQHPRLKEGPYTITPNVWTPYQLPILEERKPNGNIVVYEYSPLASKDYPGYQLISSITAYNASKTKVLGSLQFKYTMTHNRINGIEVIGSDGRKATLHYDYADVLENGEYLKYLSSVERPSQAPLKYLSDKTTKMKNKEGKRIKGVERPDGRNFLTEYHKDTWKVTAQYAPLGPNGEMSPINKYAYHKNATEVIDALGNKKIYHFDAHQRVSRIETLQNGAVYSTQRFKYDPQTGNLLSKTFEDSCEEYKYDKNHNIVEEKHSKGNESYTIYRTFSDDGFNLKLFETDNFGKNIRYSYVKGTNLIASELVYGGDVLRKRAFFFYDDCAICVRVVVDDGSTENPDDLTNVTCRRIKVIKPRYDHPCFGLPESIEEKTIDPLGQEVLLSKIVYAYAPSGKITKEEHYDATNTKRYTLKNEYDKNERLVSSTDALGNKTTYTYDANNNLLTLSGPSDLKKEWVYDKADRPIKMTDNNNLTVVKSYDKLGRVITETDECGATTRFEYDAIGRLLTTFYADGSATRKEYDVYSNVIKEIDGKGFETKKTYNFRGQVIKILHPDGGVEEFSYRSDGKLLASIDRNGAKKVYKYDVFDHVVEESTYSGNGILLKRSSSTYSPFVLLSTRDAEGVTTNYTYDFAGRKIGAKTESRESQFSYDALGRLFKTQIGDTIYIEDFDLLNRLIEKRTESEGVILTQESYKYDCFGNKTEITTCRGSTKTLYNTRGEVVSITDPLGHTTKVTCAYGKGGHVKTVTNPKKLQKVSVFNSRNKEIETCVKNEKGECIQKTTRVFDANNNQVESTDFIYEGTVLKRLSNHKWTFGPCNKVTSFNESGCKKTVYQYDKVGRLKTVIKPNGVALQYGYDDIGRLSRFSSDDFDYHYIYDRLDHLLSVTDGVSGISTGRAYDAFGHVIWEKLGNGLTVENGFDNSGKRVLLMLPDKTSAAFSYKGDNLYAVSRKNLTHTYAKRDLEGNPTVVTLPCDLGTIKTEYDPLSRIKSVSSSYYEATFPSNSYDETGNLCCFEYKDPLGTVKEKYGYDPLDQMVSENNHNYTCDSINNRTSKDDVNIPLNALSQIATLLYDQNGNLLEYEGWKFTYDSQDRLISAKKGTAEVKYAYDSFGRRILKTYLNESKKIKTQAFIYDGENEIGSADEQGKIEELRILGEGLGAEIGGAVIIELGNKTYIPIHDFRGNLATLVDPITKKGEATYRYTAFGEELTERKLCPWRYASKRHDPETHFINFGKRYYCPNMGRFLTADPQGFAAGPNLYTYVSNNPLTHLDLYGLIEHHRGRGLLNELFYFFSNRHTHHRENNNHTHYCRHYYPTYEDKLLNKSKILDLGLKPHSDHHIGFTNGIKNSESEARSKALMLSSMAGDINVDINYSASNSLSKDLYTALAYLNGIVGPDAINQIAIWTNFFTQNPNGYYQQFCHSRGTALVRNALRHTPQHIRERIYVVAVAPSAYIPRHLASRVAHITSKRDLVPWIDLRGRLACKDTTTVLSPHKDAGFFDHGMESLTYRTLIQNKIDDFFKWGSDEN